MWIQQYCLVDIFIQPDFFFVFSLVVGTVFVTAVIEKPSRLCWSYRFTLHDVFSLWKGERELGLLTAGNWGLVQAQSW